MTSFKFAIVDIIKINFVEGSNDIIKKTLFPNLPQWSRHSVDTRRRATAPTFCLFNKKGFFSIGGNKDFIGVAI